MNLPTSKPKKTRTPPPAEGGYLQIAVVMPVAYLEILEAEAGRLHMRKGAFLELLLLRQLGELNVERPASAPVVKQPSPKKMQETQRWIWHCQPEVKAQIDELLAKSGGLPPRSWIFSRLHSWLGWPTLDTAG